MDQLKKDFILQLSGSDDLDVFSERVGLNLNRVLDYLFLKQDETKDESKYHHINPVFALSNFSEGESRKKYRLWQHTDNKVLWRKTTGVAGITDFNTSKILFSREPWVIERHYSEIESDLSETVKSFKNFDGEDISSKIDDISLFVSLQITRSLRNRNAMLHSIGSSIDDIYPTLMKAYSGSNEMLGNTDCVKDEIALALSLRDMSIHYRDLLNRSIIFIHPEKSTLLTSSDPAVFHDNEYNLFQTMDFNSSVLYPLSRNTLLLFEEKDRADSPVELLEVFSDEYIDCYNRMLFNQSPKNEVFFHPNDKDYFSNLLGRIRKD